MFSESGSALGYHPSIGLIDNEILYSGLIGADSGSIWMSVALKIFKLEAREASAMTRVMAFMSNACALIIFHDDATS